LLAHYLEISIFHPTSAIQGQEEELNTYTFHYEAEVNKLMLATIPVKSVYRQDIKSSNLYIPIRWVI